MNKYPTVTIRIDEETLQRINRIAELRGITRIEYIKRAVTQQITKDVTAFHDPTINSWAL